ncbi:MAG: hypothetical protein ACRD9S_19700 [Pyrinomonadaceae bacterium]
MKNIKSELDDWMRPEYKRSDFGEIVRGKFADSEVDFQQLTEILLTCIGEDEGVVFIHHSGGNYLANHKDGDWTYEFDNANQITLRYWLNEFGSIEETITNPTSVATSRHRKEFQDALLKGVIGLKTKVGALSDRQ